MRTIVDANRVISALLRAGSTRRSLIECESELFAPATLLDEIDRYSEEIARRAGLSHPEYELLLGALLAGVSIVERTAFEPFLEVALSSMTDRDDAPYLAAALAIGADAIWSEDKHFDAQSLVPRTRHPDRIER